jgi:hypothetical protein
MPKVSRKGGGPKAKHLEVIMPSIGGKLKVSKKLRAAREERFAVQVLEPLPMRTHAHTEGVVTLNADPLEKLVSLCRRRLTNGEALTELQTQTLARAGVALASLLAPGQPAPAPATRPPTVVLLGGASPKAPVVILAGSGKAAGASPRVLLGGVAGLLARFSGKGKGKSLAALLRRSSALLERRRRGEALNEEEEDLANAKEAIAEALAESEGGS